ncbi:MAG: SOS response-associated peptidase [Chitinophagales bacterium]
MCARYLILGEEETYYTLLNLRDLEGERDYFRELTRYNIVPGVYIPIITKWDPVHTEFMKWGFIPSWAKEKKYAPVNARAEGDLNPEDADGYDGPWGIFNKPFFRDAIRRRRCLIPATAIVEGPMDIGLKKPYLIYLRERKVFYMAGIYDQWTDRATGEIIPTVAIITMGGNALARSFGHVRMPVILPAGTEKAWLEAKTDAEVSSFFHAYPAAEMNAFPIDPAFRNPRHREPKYLRPIGDTIYPETAPHVLEEIEKISNG